MKYEIEYSNIAINVFNLAQYPTYYNGIEQDKFIMLCKKLYVILTKLPNKFFLTQISNTTSL